MALSRRRFLQYAVGSGAALSFGGIPLLGGEIPRSLDGKSLSNSLMSGSGQPLRIPATFSGTSIAASVQHQTIWPDASTEVWTFGGSYPAPTIRVRKGDAFTMKLTNQLAEPTNIHWHGLTVPAGMDGYPSDVALPGGTFDYAFKIDQRAGTYWYHPHPDMKTGPQVYKGMAGLLIVEDDEEQALGLPSGEFEIPMIIQDRRTTPTRDFTYELSDSDHSNGYLGDTILVNGTPDAYLEVSADLYRFRILNGSNARVLDLALSDGKSFHVIGTDGGLLDKPYDVSYVYLAPAERIELLIDFSGYNVGDSITFNSLPFSGGKGFDQGIGLSVLRFDVTRASRTQNRVPAALVPYEHLDASKAARTRKFTLRIDHTTLPEGHTINDKMFDMARIDEEVPVGDLEIWTFENVSFLYHPMHLHGAQFQVLRRSSATQLAPRDLGWKDTVYVRPFETVDVIVRFSPYLGVFLMHCHNLEHEDHGMMLNFRTIAANAGVDGADGPVPLRLDLQ